MELPLRDNAWHVDWFVDHESVRQDVTVRIAGGRVVDVQPGGASDAVNLGHVALIPGLVNAHTHLEFSLLPEAIPTGGRFTDWIRAVVKHRRAGSSATPEAIRRGLRECVESGTTLVGDIATSGWQPADYSAEGFAGVVFQELLGLAPERVSSQRELARSLLAGPTWFPRGPGDECLQTGPAMFGLSPHAPYSVHPDLLQSAISAATEFHRPVAMHLAETAAELELLAEGSGEFRDLLVEFGIWSDGLFGGQSFRHYLELLAAAPRALVVHGNYLDDGDLEFLAAQRQMTLVYCPRTHAAFGHPPHPWRRVLELGGAVALGTDSRASNPDLSLFAELQFLAARHPGVSHLQLLKLATQAGRTALFGSSADHARADFCAVALDQPAADPARHLFAARNRVAGTMIGGEWRSVLPEIKAVRTS